MNFLDFKTAWSRAFAIIMINLLGSLAMASGAGVTYHGRLLKPNGQAVTSSSVQFRIQIRTESTSGCLMYEEIQTKNLSTSDGLFALTLNDSTATVVNTEPYTLEQVFRNQGSITFPTGKCSGGNIVNFSSTDARQILVSFNDGTFGGWEPLPSQQINFVPTALESVTVGGFRGGELFRVVDGSGVPQALSAWSPSSYAALTGLIGGITSSTPSNGDVLSWNASQNRWQPAPPVSGGGGGDVMSTRTLNAGTGLTGGGDLSADRTFAVNVGTGANQIPQLDGSGKLASSVIPSSILNSSTTAGGDLSGTYPSPLVAKIQGNNVASTTFLNAGQVYRWNGSNLAPGFVGLADIRSTATGNANVFPTTCTASQTMVWTSPADVFSCVDVTIAWSKVTSTPTTLAGYGITDAASASNVVLKGGQNGALTAGTNDANSLTLETNNSPRLTIDATGNVGIGLTNPSEKLEVAGKVKGTEVCIGSDCRAVWPTSGGGGGGWVNDGTTVLNAVSSTADTWYTLDLSSRVGANKTLVMLQFSANGSNQSVLARTKGETTELGYPSSTTSHGSGTSGCQISTGRSCYLILQTDATGAIEYKIVAFTLNVTMKLVGYMVPGSAVTSVWALNGSDAYRSTGNVGIGTNTPAQKLSVNGTIESMSGGFRFPDGTTQTTAATGSGSGAAGAAVAWVAFNGSTGAITASFNVASVTRTGVGTYSVAFASALSNANYAVMVSGQNTGNGDGSAGAVDKYNYTTPKTTTSVKIGTGSLAGAWQDWPEVYVAVYHGNGTAALSNGHWTQVGNDAAWTTGNVGIGTSTPAAKLDVAGEVKFGNTSSTCNTTNEGQQRYNSTSKNMEFCNGTAWTAYGTGGGGGGRTSCPAGFTLMGTSGSAEAYCISSAQETATTWSGAVAACYAKSPKARLCSVSEWATACVAGAAGPNNMTGHWEWVADLDVDDNNVGLGLMGNPGCASAWSSGAGSSVGSRCCFR